MKKLYPILALLFVLASCQTIKYISDYNSSTDFTAYKTYNMMQWNKGNDRYLNNLDKQRVLAAIDMEMTRLGFTKSTTPDAMLNVHVIIEEKTGTHAYTTYMGGYYTPFGYGVTTYQDYTYLVGTLVIDMFDEKTKQQIWQGGAIGEVEEGNERKEENVNRIINRIMKKYPIQPSSK
jgi:hypothetical protein